MRVGIIIENTSFSQLTLQMADNYHKIKEIDQHVDCTVFTLARKPSIAEIPCAIFPAQYAWHFRGPLIATNIETAKVLLNCRGTKNKYFYVWDCEWMHEDYSVRDIESIYMNKDLQIIVRSKDMYDLFERCWRKPHHIVGEFDYAKLIRSIEKI